MRFGLFLFLSLLLALALSACATHPGFEMTADKAPESATGFTPKAPVESRRFMVATASPFASDAAYQILKAGGSAVDAAIAAQAMLGLTEPQSSGIGGGACLVYFDGHQVTTFDGREVAPAAAMPERFLDNRGKVLPFYDAVVGGRSVGVPGVVAMLELAHQRYGKLPWATLFEPAIRRAEAGFPMSPRLYGLLATERYLKRTEPARSYFHGADGTPKPVGTVLRNPEYAATLQLIARDGAQAFYQGLVAQDIVKAVASHPTNPGDLTLQDLRQYRAKPREPVCGPYRRYVICGMGPPSAGGVSVLQILGVLERFPLASRAPVSADTAHLFSEAGRLAFADRGMYLADPDFVAVPVAGLIDRGYLAQRSQLIDPRQSMSKAQAGIPPGANAGQGRDHAIERPGTSHIVAVDGFGHALSMTSSIEDQFGSRLMVRGFLLNNQLTDFSFNPIDQGRPVANRVEGGKRPRSSMAPVLVFDQDGQFKAAAGSPGGSQIINYVAQTLIGLLDWGLNPQEAVSLPHYGSRNGPTELERGRGLESLAEQLQARGHDVRLIDMPSGLSAVVRTPSGWIGGADLRREGLVLGD